MQGKLNLDIDEVKMVYFIQGLLIYTVLFCFFTIVSLKASSFPMGRCMLGDFVELSLLSGGSVDGHVSGHLRIVSE